MYTQTDSGHKDCPKDSKVVDDKQALRPDDLTAFQRDILTILADGPQHGLGIKASLEDYYGIEKVFHGRLYPNLDSLVEDGLIDKGKRDDRTNEYKLTDLGREVVDAKLRWMAHHRGVAIPALADEVSVNGGDGE